MPALHRKTMKNIRYTKAPISTKIKMDGKTVVSRALVKPGTSNLIPKMHIKRGDLVMLINGGKQTGKGQTGKVLHILPSTGKVVVEGINIVTRATKQRTAMGKSGLIKKEAPVFASRVMLYCNACKKPTRIKHHFLDSGKKVRVCRHCTEALDS